METDVAQVARSSAYILTMDLAIFVISMAAFSFMAAYLGPAEMGVWTVMLMVLGAAGVLPTLISAPVKFISQAVGAGEDHASIITSILLARLAMGCAVGTFFILASGQLAMLLLGGPGYAFVFQLLGIDVIFYMLRACLNTCLLGLNKAKEMSISRGLWALLRQALVIALLWLGLGLLGLVLAWVLSDMLSCIYPAALLLAGGHLKRVSAREAGRILSDIFKFSIPIFATTIVTFASNWFDRAIILGSRDLGELGIYNVALTAYGILMTVPKSVGMAVSPYYGAKFGRKEHEDVRSTTKMISKYLALLFMPTSLGLAALSYLVLMFIAGESYAQGHEILMLISVLGTASIISSILLRYLITYERTIAYMAVKISSIAAGTTLALVLLPLMGLFGVALAKGISAILLAALCVLATRSEIRLAWSSISRCFLAASVMAALVYVIQALVSSLLLLPAYVLLGAATYGLMVKALGVLSEEDVRILTAVFPAWLRGPLFRLGLLFSRSPREEP
ncbi:hypothetical protein DRO33_00575 [Candidatus Bathyarchaeota archaeon]|nr:MAG: hypothetical protein DRO33_00575 [Candidatus Bathyarchaeota archaeon]